MYVSFTCPSILESKHPCSFRNYNYICRIRPLFKLLRKKWTFREPSFMFFCRNISSFPSWQYTTAHITLTFISSTWEREKKTITMLYCIRICFFFQSYQFKFLSFCKHDTTNVWQSTTKSTWYVMLSKYNYWQIMSNNGDYF